MQRARAAFLGLLLAAPLCPAAELKQFGSTPLYLSVDADGVVLYSDIAPEPPADAAKPSSRRMTPRLAASAPSAGGLRVAADAPPTRATVLPVAMGEAADEVGAEQEADAAIRPEQRDGGAPPDDH